MKDRISVMIPEEKIKSRIAELGEEISRDYEGKSIHMICVLKGGVYFMTALSERIDPEIPVSLDFMSVSSYGDDTKSSGIVRIIKDLDEPVEGKDVLVVEDNFVVGCGMDYHQNYRNLPYIGQVEL